MAVFPLENGVFSGTLLRFNVRGYVYIWSLIFSMFNFFVFVGVFVGAGVFIRARRACLLRFMRARGVFTCALVHIHYTFI